MGLGRSRALSRSLVVGLVAGCVVWSAPAPHVVAQTGPVDAGQVMTTPPEGAVLDASTVPPLRSAPLAPMEERRGGQVPAPVCSDYPAVAGSAPTGSAVDEDEPAPIEGSAAVPASDILSECVVDPQPLGGELPDPKVGDRSGFDPDRSVEVVEKRSEFAAVFANPDGTESVRLTEVPQHFEVAPDRWEPIDSSLVPAEGAAGVWVTAANSWQASFAPGTVGLTTAAGAIEFGFVAEGSETSRPEVSEDRSLVSYREVWPGVDVEYRPGPAGVEEQLVVYGRDVPLEMEFSLNGARTGERTPDGGLRLEGVEGVSLSGLFSFGVDGTGLELEGAPRLEGRGDRVAVVIDEKWLAAVPDAAFPITIDPTWQLGSTNRRCFAKPKTGSPIEYSCTSGANVGNVPSSSTNWQTWRSAIRFDYAPYWIGGAFVEEATLQLDWVNTAGNDTLTTVSVYEGWGDIAAASYTSYVGSPLATAWLGSPFYPPTTAYLDVTTVMEWWRQVGWAGGMFQMIGAEPNNATTTFKKFTHTLWLTINTPPPAPTLVAPADNTVQHPAGFNFSVSSVNDAEGDTVYYRFFASTSATCAPSSVVMDSGWLTVPSYPWNVPQALDNTDLYWCAQTSDGLHPEQTSGPRRFRSNNSLPTISLVSPANNTFRVNDTPTLTATIPTDPDAGDATSYRFVISPLDGIGIQAASEWKPVPGGNASWTVPAGALDPSTSALPTSYKWGVEVKDERSASTSTLWTIRNQPYLGAAPTAPMQSVGPVSVNLATGNVHLATGSPAVSTVGGPVGVSYAYNSQDRTNFGLRATYFNDANANLYQDGGEQIYLSRRDALPSFNWNLGSPGASVPSDNFAAQWNGYITVPTTGSWQFRMAHDDGVFLRVNGTALINSPGCCGVWVCSPDLAPLGRVVLV